MTQRLGRNMSEILRRRRCIVPLSGGRDSRCLIASALADMGRAETLFAWRFHRQSVKDAGIGALIADHLSLPFKEYRHVKLTAPVRALFFKRNGYSYFGDALRSLAISEGLPGGMVMPRGNIMGLVRATNWPGKTETMPFDVDHALRRLHIGTIADRKECVENLKKRLMAWYEGVPLSGRENIYDILWLDMVLTHGQGARQYGTPNNFVVNPFNDRRLIQLAMQLPVSLRRTDRAYDMMLDRTAPDLKRFDYN